MIPQNGGCAQIVRFPVETADLGVDFVRLQAAEESRMNFAS